MWLVGKTSEEDAIVNVEDGLVFEDDGVAIAIGVGNAKTCINKIRDKLYKWRFTGFYFQLKCEEKEQCKGH